MSSDSGGNVTHHKPQYKDGELLHELYVEEEMAMADIADELDCAPNTVRKYLIENGIEIRDISSAIKISYGHRPNEVPFHTKQNQGIEVWYYNNSPDDKGMVIHHRLLAVAIWGFDAVKDMVVHHKNEIRWDNRLGNLELMELGEHSSHHNRMFDEETRREIADRYEHTEESSYQIAEDYPISPTTVRDIREEYYGDENGGEKAT